MRGDFSRLSFDPHKHFSSVRMQQGRVQLDADWNEQADIVEHRVSTQITDFIGQSGAPEGNAGFAITPAPFDLTIGPGRYYVDGLLLENEASTSFSGQPDYPNPPRPTPGTDGTYSNAAGTYLAYLDVWQRHLTALDDPSMTEVALGGPDTTTRLKNLWQVKLSPVGISNDAARYLPGWQPDWPNADKPISTGTLAARVSAVGATLENQLYRVEIHQGWSATSTDPGSVTFKWSRDNGAVAAAISAIAGQTITVSSTGRDTPTGFAAQQWVEVTDDARTLAGQPGVMVQLAAVQDNSLTVVAWPSGFDPTTLRLSPTVRRWDSPGAVAIKPPAVAGSTGWIPLEDAIEVQFGLDATFVYKSGDYWLIPARTLTGDIDWPRDSNGVALTQGPLGVLHHYSALALLALDATGTWSVTQDLRVTFRALTTGLVSKGGDVMTGPLTIQAALDQVNADPGAVHQAALEVDQGVHEGLALLLKSSGTAWGSGMVLANTSATGRKYGIASHQDGSLHITDSTDMVQDSVDLLVITQGGNVGIGTTTPRGFQVVLPESSKTQNPGVTIVGGQDGNASIELRNNGTGTPYIDFSQSVTPDYDGRLRLVAIAQAATASQAARPAQMAVEGANLLVVQDIDFGSQTRQMLNLWGTEYGIGVQSGTLYHRTDDSFAWFRGGSHRDNQLDAGGGTVQMTLNSSGNLGIGTSTPRNPLGIRGTGLAQELISFEDPNGTTKWHFNQNLGGNNPGLNLAETGVADGRLFIQAGGNVGIGTTKPLYRLHIVAPGSFGPEDANGVSLAGGVPLIVQSDSTAFGVLNSAGRPAFALNIDSDGGTANQRGVPTFYDRYDGNWHPAISLQNGNVRINENSLLLRSGADPNHGIAWNKYGLKDGPVIWGNSGGTLATAQNDQNVQWALTWSTDGTISVNGAIHGHFGDVAENFVANSYCESGDVVCMDRSTEGIIVAEEPNSPLVLGVISKAPALLLNSDHNHEQHNIFPVALSGRVPCKVVDENGPIYKGDLLTSSSSPGHAMKATSIKLEGHDFVRPGTIIGKALDSHLSGRGVIDILVLAR